MKRWNLFAAVLALAPISCVNDTTGPTSSAPVTAAPDGSFDPILPSEKQVMPVEISRESCLWLAARGESHSGRNGPSRPISSLRSSFCKGPQRIPDSTPDSRLDLDHDGLVSNRKHFHHGLLDGVPLGQPALLWFASAEARLVEIGDDGVHGVLRFPSDVHPDTGASLGTTFRLDGDLAELRMGSQTIDQTDRREYSEALFAWEHFVYQAPTLFPLPAAADAVQAIIRVPIARVACEEAPVAGGVRHALRWDAPVPPRYLGVTAGPIAVYSDPDTGALLGIEFAMREALANEVCYRLGSPHCEIHFLTMSGGRPKVVVLEYSDDSGEQNTEHRRYDVRDRH